MGNLEIVLTAQYNLHSNIEPTRTHWEVLFDQ